MKESFQAKDILKILGIPKPRYGYLITKMGITPDVREVDGQGKSHLYSFKNVLQFAYSHHASRLGFTPKAVKSMLHIIDNYPKIEEMGIFDPSANNTVILYYVESGEIIYFKLLNKSGRHKNELNITTGAEPLEDHMNRMRQEYIQGNIVNTVIKNPGLKWLFSNKRDYQILENADAYIALNLTAIKKRVTNNIRKIE